MSCGWSAHHNSPLSSWKARWGTFPKVIELTTSGWAILLAGALIVGALLGRVLVKRMDQTLFTNVVLVLTVVSSLYLLR